MSRWAGTETADTQSRGAQATLSYFSHECPSLHCPLMAHADVATAMLNSADASAIPSVQDFIVDEMSSDSDSFNTEDAVETYRAVVRLRDAEPTVRGKAGFQSTLNEMRGRWKRWHGTDSLHELAFGKPDDSAPLPE